MAFLPLTPLLRALIERRTILTRLLLPLLLLGLLLGIGGSATLAFRIAANIEKSVTQQAAETGRDLMYLAQMNLSQEHLQRLVTAKASQRGVNLALIASGNPVRVQASSRSAWIGKDFSEVLAEVADAKLTSIMTQSTVGQPLSPIVQRLDDKNIFVLTRFRLPAVEAVNGGQVAFAMVIIDPTAAPIKAIEGASLALLAFVLIGLILLIAAWFVLTRGLLRPLGAMVQVLESRVAGNLTQRVPLTTRDEIGKLGASLNNAFDEIDRLSVAREKRMAELQKAHADLRLRDSILDRALSSSRSVAYTCHASGDFGAIYVHDSIRAVTGHTPEEFIARSDFWESHIHPEDRPAVLARLGALFEAGTTCHYEYRFRTADGRYVWISDHLTLERDGEGRPLHISGIITDITERKSVEAQLRESQKLEAVGQLTGGLAHDFNNLLGIVVGNLDEIGERLPQGDARLRGQHRAALEAALRGAEVTRALLAVARRQPLEVGGYDVNVLLAEFVPLARSSAGSAVTVRSDLAAGELRARLDAAGLSNVILNLVINARDAMQDAPGERRITLRTRRVHIAPGADEALTPGGYALLEVADTGAGMSAQIRAQAFEPFFTTKERGHGTGLGLAMVHGYATQLGGTARIQSEPGRGTTVQLYLPMEAQASVAVEAVEAQRLAALQAHAILDTAPEAQFDALVAEAARLCETPIALVSLVDEHRQWFKARVGLQASQTAREQAFCAHAIVDPGGVLVVPDATRDVRFSANPLVTGEPHVGFYAGVVLHDAAGEALGTLCVIDHVPRQLNAVQLAELAALAERVAGLIRARRPPRAAPDVALPPVARTTTAPAPAPLGANQGKRVLVVDDEEALCELACDWLDSLGYQPTGVHSPAAALERLAAEPFDILFTDIVMPGGMDGLALARQAKSRHPHLRVVLTSGYAQGLTDTPDLPGSLLNKPYRKNDLRSALA